MADADVLINLSTAIYTKFSTENDFKTSVNGQLYENEADEDAVYPYAIYSLISAPKEKTFSEEYTNTYVEIKLYSVKDDSFEILNMYYQSTKLFHDCDLSVTGSTFIWMLKENLLTDIEEETTLPGTRKIRVYYIDYEIKTVLN